MESSFSRPQPSVNQLTLSFVPTGDGASITWESPLIGRRVTTFRSPYDAATLPTVIKALDAVQHPGHPTAGPQFLAEEQSILQMAGLWQDGAVAPLACQLVGQALYESLGPEGMSVLEAVRNAAIAQGQRTNYVLRFPPEAVLLAALPWEALADSRNRPILMARGSDLDTCERYITSDQTLPPPLPAGQIPHLLALLPAYDVPDQARQEEHVARLAIWGELRDAGLLTFDEIGPPLTVRALNDYLRRAERRPDVVHFFGHGSYRDGQGYLLFDDESGGRSRVSVERIATSLGDVRLTMLLSCESSQSEGEGSLLTGLAPALSQQIGAVVALPFATSVGLSTRFAQIIYEDLFRRGKSLQEAVASGRQAIFAEDDRGASWYLPSVYIRAPEPRQLYLVEQAAPSTDADREHLEKLLKTFKQRLRNLELQNAQFGLSTPTHIVLEIESTRQEIAATERQVLALSAKSPIASLEPPPVQDTLSERWQRAAFLQREAGNGAFNPTVVPELQAFLNELCKLLDFRIVAGSEYNHHNQFVACRVAAPTLHLNLPGEFPLTLLLAPEVSPEVIDQLPDVWRLMGLTSDFGLVLVAGSHTRIQQMINVQIRPAMKSDLIALGVGFLNDIAASPLTARTPLLNAILREVELTRVSPFMAGGDVSERMFFGREGELKDIAEAVGKTSVAITCGRRIGKTTLLNRLAHTVLPGRGHRCYFLNCQPAQDYRELRGEMALQWERSDLPFDPDNPNSFAAVAAALAGPNGAPPIFLLDEVDTLLRYDSEQGYRLFKQMRALSFADRARFIVTGERSVLAELRNADSPLFNFFGLSVKLSFLTRAAVTKLVLDPLSDMQVELGDPLPMLDTIATMTSGHPYLVQRLCQSLVKACSLAGRRIITPGDIEQCLDDSDYQQDYFATVWGQAPQLARIITLLVDANGATLSEIRKRLAAWKIEPTLEEIMFALTLLDLYSVLARKGSSYTFVMERFPAMVERAYGDDREIHIELLCDTYLASQRTGT